MADVRPLQALHYDLERVGPLGAVVSPPYDVIGPAERAELVARSPYNVVNVDLPEDPGGGDPYAHAAAVLAGWREAGAVVQDEGAAVWAITQDYDGVGGIDDERKTRSGFLCRVRVDEYGPGRIRPHERTHPGPKEDRLRLTRATQTNLSPIFALYDDRDGLVGAQLAAHTTGRPYGEATDEDGTHTKLWRVAQDEALDTIENVLETSELLIADGHHRYETARVYAEEIGGEGPQRWVLMCLVALQDPGLTVYPTHRLVKGTTREQQMALRDAMLAAFDVEEVAREDIVPDGTAERMQLGYMDSFHKQGYRFTLKDPAIVDEALAGKPEPYKQLDTAVVEALFLKGPLELTEDDISHFRGLNYARDTASALAQLDDGSYDLAFFLASTPVERVQAVAAAGENMPPKSTYFFPKVPTGLVFNPVGADT